MSLKVYLFSKTPWQSESLLLRTEWPSKYSRRDTSLNRIESADEGFSRLNSSVKQLATKLTSTEASQAPIVMSFDFVEELVHLVDEEALGSDYIWAYFHLDDG